MRSWCYAMKMKELDLSRLRIAALQAAIDRVSDGNKSAFGRRIGYKDGAFVRQMLSGERPITEKTIRVIEQLPELKGWFAKFEENEAVATQSKSKHKTSEADASIKGSNPGVLAGRRDKGRPTMEKNIQPGPKQRGTFPLISWVQAGTWESIVENFSRGDADDWLDSPVAVSAASFYLTVRGESMYDPSDHRSFREGEIILIDPRETPTHGAFVLVLEYGETEPVLRQLLIEGNHTYYKALNPGWPNRIAEADGTEAICGVVRTKIVRY